MLNAVRINANRGVNLADSLVSDLSQGPVEQADSSECAMQQQP